MKKTKKILITLLTIFFGFSAFAACVPDVALQRTVNDLNKRIAELERKQEEHSNPCDCAFGEIDELNKKIDEAFNRQQVAEDLEVKVNG